MSKALTIDDIAASIVGLRLVGSQLAIEVAIRIGSEVSVYVLPILENETRVIN